MSNDRPSPSAAGLRKFGASSTRCAAARFLAGEVKGGAAARSVSDGDGDSSGRGPDLRRRIVAGPFVPRPRVPGRRHAGRSASARAASVAPPAMSAARQQPSSPASAEQENLFWQSVVNSTDPADFEAYLEVFPNGVFRRLAENRLAAVRSAGGAAAAGAGRPSVGAAPAVAGSRVGGGAVSGTAGVGDPVRRRVGEVFRDCAECPEMVVMAGGRLAMGRYELTVGEYRAFVSATGGTGDDEWRDHNRFSQTDRHPVVLVSWEHAQAYVSWLSRRTGAAYRLPTEAEWERAAAGSPVGCSGRLRSFLQGSGEGTCPVGSYGSNSVSLSDMVGKVWEWASDCWEDDCGIRVLRGDSWFSNVERRDQRCETLRKRLPSARSKLMHPSGPSQAQQGPC